MPSGDASHIARKRSSLAPARLDPRALDGARDALGDDLQQNRGRPAPRRIRPRRRSRRRRSTPPRRRPATAPARDRRRERPAARRDGLRNLYVRGMRTTPPRRRLATSGAGSRSSGRCANLGTAFIARIPGACHSWVSVSSAGRLVQLVVEGAVDAALQADRRERARDRFVGRLATAVRAARSRRSRRRGRR